MTKLRDTLVAAAHLIADAIESSSIDASSSRASGRRRRRGPRSPAEVMLPVSLSERVKSGQSWAAQNRPVAGRQDTFSLYPATSSGGKASEAPALVRQLRGPHLMA